MEKRQQSKNNVQLVWGAALILMGIAVFFKIPQVMPQFIQMGLSSSMIWTFRICLYLMGIMLVGGGIKKIFQHTAQAQKDDTESS